MVNEKLKHDTMEHDLLFKYFRGETTKQEEERVLEWVERSPKNPMVSEDKKQRPKEV